jgi:hypothetical protein
MIKKRSPSIGDVFELATPCGYALLQYTHEHRMYGSVIRVLPGLTPEPHRDLEALVGGPERFFAFFPVKVAARDDLFTRVVRFEVPEHARSFPTMRIELLTGGWAIMANATEVVEKVGKLSPEQELLPRVETWPKSILLSRVASDWTWAHDVREEEGEPAAPCYDIGVGWPDPQAGSDEIGVGSGEHYAYFATRDAALEAKLRVEKVAARTDVQRATEPDAGWVLTAVEAADSDELEDALVAAAGDLGGEYDGSERRLA